MTPTNPEATGPDPASPGLTIFAASVLGLFLELALIRWVSSELRVFAYCKNLVLVASFLGFGTGCFLAGRKPSISRALLLLLVLTGLIRLPWPVLKQFGPQRVTSVLAGLPGFMIFRHADVTLSWGLVGNLAFAVGWTAIIFFLIALILVPFGQLTASGMARLGRPLRAYSLNVAGSLVGILAYTATTAIHLPPITWFVPVALALTLFERSRGARAGALALTIALALAFIPGATPGEKEIWSSYQKLQLIGNDLIRVNNIGYQAMRQMGRLVGDDPLPADRIDRFNMPYALQRPAGRVLIVGAGSGNDVATAIKARATSVTAVEIDPVIQGLGRALHPQQPYSDPRVRVVIDDARHFLRTTRDQFDVIVFSHLDSHTVLSSYTNVQLDNYIYTVEAFQEARTRLAPDGLLYVSFWVERPFVGQRLFRNLGDAFGHAPVALESDTSLGGPDKVWHSVHFLTGRPDVVARWDAAARGWEPLIQRLSFDPDIAPSTDAWPFLHLESHRIPPIILVISGVILALSMAFAWRFRPPGEPFDGRLFWLGAAFMLVEVHNVSRLALVFGTTWQVNAWVIGAILVVILLANAAYGMLRDRGRGIGRWAMAALFVTLLAAWTMPLEGLLARAGALGGPAATLVMTAPLFFAGLVFAEAFADTPSPGFALGWNVLGSVVGGMTENLSYVLGIPALVPLAALFYTLALVWSRRREATVALPSPSPEGG
jgi:SAM-dependent methyltransferase